MVRRSQEFYDAISNIPKPTGGQKYPQPHAEITASVAELVRDSAAQHELRSAMPNMGETRPKNTFLQQAPSETKKIIVTDSAKTRDLVHEKIDYPIEKRFDDAVRAIELRYAEKIKPFEKTLAGFTSLSDSDPITFYLVQPQIERLNASIRTLEEQRNAQIERARADYFFERSAVKTTETEFVRQNFERLVRDFDEQINLIAQHYDRRIQKIIDELDDFFPDHTIVRNHIHEKITELLKELQQSELTATNAKKFEQVSQDIIDLMKLKSDLRNHRPTETERGAVLENELRNLLSQRTNEIEAARKRFEYAVQQNHARITSPFTSTRVAIEERFIYETAPLRSTMKRLTEDMVRNPNDAKDIEARRIAISQLFDTLRHLRDQELAQLAPATPQKPASQKTLTSGLLDEYYYEPGAHITRPNNASTQQKT